MELGRLGVWVRRNVDPQIAAEAERLGYGAIWLGSNPSVDDARPFLEASDRLKVVTGILNVWQHDPADVAAAHARITADFPDRFLLGIGIGHPETIEQWGRPLEVMGTFLDGLDAASTPVRREERLLAALRGRMLDLSRERTLGAHPYFVPSEHTAFARERLGADVLLAPEVSVAIDDDLAVSRARASKFGQRYFALANYRDNLKSFGFDDRDFEGDGSDALLDATIPNGPLHRVAAGIRAHLDAGADHVSVQVVAAEDSIVPELALIAEEFGLHPAR